MSFEEKYEKDKEYYDRKVLKTQKVKLYNLKHWIFDFGGVMVETPNIVKKLITIINNDLGTSMSKEHPFVMKTRRRLSSGRITSKEFLKKILEKYYFSKNKNAPKVDLKHYLELWFQKYSELTQISPEMEEIVERLHRAGYHVSLMSNTYDIHAKSNELRGFFELFDDVFLSNELKMRKPEIEKYKYVIKKLNTKPKNCIFIDDKLINLVPARKLGVSVIQFKSLRKFKKYLKELGISEIEHDLRDIIDVKYKIYKTTKKDYKKSKKKVKKLKKEMKQLKKKKKKAHFKTTAKKLRYVESKLKKKKSNYSKQKKAKKEVLEPKIKLSK
jgi:epoxide hydrolase-like predicted phosphatase